MTHITEKPVLKDTATHIESLVSKERPFITIEFAPPIHPRETKYNYPHPRFTFGDRVTPKLDYPSVEYKVCALELIESVTPSGRLLKQPYWKYKISNGEVSFWKEESALVHCHERHSWDTCSNCQHFQDFQEPSGRGWCNLFDRQARTHHAKTNDCLLNEKSEEIEDKDKLYSPDQIGSIVKVIDPDEHHTEWGVFEVVECKYNDKLYRSRESYLNEAQWYYRLASNDDANTISKSLWVAENELCDFNMSHNVCTEEIF